MSNERKFRVSPSPRQRATAKSQHARAHGEGRESIETLAAASAFEAPTGPLPLTAPFERASASRTRTRARVEAARVAERDGLYRPDLEHDACGVGFVANIDGRRTREVLDRAITVLTRLEHRGATGSDPQPGQSVRRPSSTLVLVPP